jgi:chemotaxis protein CheC
VGYSAELMSSAGAPDAMVLMLHIEFVVERQQIAGDVAFIMDMSALEDLKAHVNSYLARAMGGA